MCSATYYLSAIAMNAGLFAGYLALLTGLSISNTLRAGFELGGQKWNIDSTIRGLFRYEAARISAILLLTALSIGIVFGGASALVTSAFISAISSADCSRPWSTTPASILLALIIHLSLF